jgi:hypothetical protein
MRNTDEFWRNREQSFHRQHLSRIFVCYAPARTTSRGARATCKQQEKNRLPVKGESYREPSSSIWTG